MNATYRANKIMLHLLHPMHLKPRFFGVSRGILGRRFYTTGGMFHPTGASFPMTGACFPMTGGSVGKFPGWKIFYGASGGIYGASLGI